ncbi:TonB-dependent receptor [Flavihumibacter sp. CACIAM 22H1]|uniref:TonB-dependent receptor n=1 Tax=Flavihumibacter sp. CACIAM 22H1 TaxID=1812911 RepID=UPI0007A92257|nr:TonB-dependent receptor [Flavihumibacter sp. CACIAM 22H1]KYP15482.1 MAG: TonB-dependent receptor [Flavihumibacter sp. CACIAM 22H1]
MKRIIPIVVFVLLAGISQAQTSLTGFIKDDKGQAVEAATIKVKGSVGSTVADSKGKFQLTTPRNLPFTLQISSAGYTPSEIELTQLRDSVLTIILVESTQLSEVVITSRRRVETAQDVPIPISVLGGAQVEDAGAFNVNRLKELVPTVQLYSSNPRNTTLNIRGIGSTFGLTNDGIDPGVGFYVDGVYYARPAATTLDFIDIEQVEVLRGPQGTLFGKNTTAGAFNITTRAPKFKPGANFEVSYGNYGFVQAKASITGGITKKLAGRISFSGTQRNGLLENVATGKSVNDLNNIGVRGQLLYTPTDKVKITFIGDITDQKPDGYAQVIAGVVQTQRPGYRQFDSIIADLGYQLPSRNPFDRKIDHNTTWKSGNQLGGASVNIDAKIGGGTLTSTTAWRYWNWDPSNDRDFTGLPVLTLSQATSKHQQWTQEIRYAGDFSSRLSGVAGVFLIGQDLKTDPYHIEESGAAQWRFSKSSTSSLWETPGLFEGYGIRTKSRLKTFGAAVFGQLDWAITDKLHVLPGIRYNYDKKQVDFDRKTYGGLQTEDPALLALKRAVYTDQAFSADVDESNFSGQLTVSYKVRKDINAFATYSLSYKPVGVNLGGLPTANGEVLTDLARIKPEGVTHYEIGVKTTPSRNFIFNLVLHQTDIKDYQTQVQTAEVGVNRGYLANAEKVRVKGIESDANYKINDHITLYGNLAYTEGKYLSFTNAPVPLEETGASTSFKDVSKGDLPGISKWAGSIGGEIQSKLKKAFTKEGRYFLALDNYFRSGFSSSPSPSKYLNVPGYALFNGRVGFRSKEGISVFLWGRNLLNKNYFEQLLPAAGNAGQYAAVLGDQRTYGITLRYNL